MIIGVSNARGKEIDAIMDSTLRFVTMGRSEVTT
jgi:hypothetical protein